MNSPRRLLAVLFIGLSCAWQVALAQSPEPEPLEVNPERRATGLLPATPEELAWIDQHAKRTVSVKLNSLGLERANQKLREKDLPVLRDVPVVEIGAESVPESAPSDVGEATAAGYAVADSLSPSVDNSKLACFPEVRDQGSLGSCVSFAATYYTASHMTGLVRGWTTYKGDNTRKFSPKWTYNFNNGGEDVGSRYWGTLDTLVKMGAPLWEDWPYSGTTASSNYREWPTNGVLWRRAISYRLKEWGVVNGLDTAAGLAAAKALLQNGYLLLYATDINGWQITTFSDDPSTSADNALVGRKVCRMAKVDRSGHAMTIVGYNDTVWTDLNKNGQVDAGEKGAFKIVNSWGSSWPTPADEGFCWVAYDALRTTSAVAGADNSNRQPCFRDAQVFWITARPSYTPTLLGQFTVNHVRRNQLKLRLGISSVNTTTPTSYYPTSPSYTPADDSRQVFDYLGGPYAFNGTSIAVDGTFVFDLSDLVASGTQRYYLEVTDNTPGSIAAVSSFKLISATGATLGTASTGIPLTADGTISRAYLDFGFNAPPVITSASTANATVGTAFSYDIVASNGPTSFSASDLPPGLSLNATTGRISGTPSQAGATTVSLGATNASGSGTGTLTINVASAMVRTPDITSAVTASGRVGQAFSYTITASNSPTAFNASGLPAGLSVNTITGVISGTPTQAGTSSVTLSARNSGGTGTRTLALTIAAAAVTAPVITSSGTATGTSGSEFTYRIEATNSPTSYGATGLPSGCSVNTATGVITGTLPAARTYVVTLQATNSGGSGYRTLSLTVTGDSSFAPSNDSLANAIPLSGPTASAGGFNTNATAEAGEPAHGRSSARTSVWWGWTAPSSGQVTIRTSGSAFDTTLAVYTGSSIAGLSLVAENDDVGRSPGSKILPGAGEPEPDRTSVVTFSADAGRTYKIAVDGYYGQQGRIVLAVQQVGSGPSNDHFANRTSLAGATGSTTGSNFGASSQGGEPGHAGFAATRSVWWTWSAPGNGQVTIDTSGSNFDTLLAVYSGSSVEALTQIASDDQSGGNNTSRVVFNVTSGAVYQIAVDGWNGAQGTVKLNVALSTNTRPPNDDFASRFALTGPTASATGTNANATGENGEPAHAGNPAQRSVWWTWTAPAAGPVTIHTSGSGFDTILGVYTGTSVGALTLVASNDDTAGRTSSVSFNAVSGTVYQIAVDGYEGAVGAIALSVQQSANVAPSNDNFAGRATLAGNLVNATGLNVNATAENGEPAHAGIPATRSLWWKWTATQSGRLTITTAGSSFDTVLAVYSGTSLGELKAVSTNDDYGESHTSTVVLFVTTGTTYSIAVDGYHGDVGTIALSLSFASSNDLYSTNFDSFPTGGDKLAGTDGWMSDNTVDAASGVFQDGTSSRAAWLGYTATSEQSVFVWHPLDYDPVAAGTPIIQFSVDLGLIDSSNGRRDNFYVFVYNRAGKALGAVNFDNTNQRVYRYDGSAFSVVGTFARNTTYTLTATIDFASNRWSAALGRTPLFSDQPLNATAQTLNLGDIDLGWVVTTTGSPGNNVLVFDNYRVAVVPTSSAPTISSELQPQAVYAGQAASFTVAATGTPAPTYQWYKDGVVISGATSATFVLGSVQWSDTGTYTVVVSNSAGSVTSNPVTLTLNNPPGRLVNLSVLTEVTDSSPMFTLGTVIGGAGTTGTKPLVVRAAGPSLTAYGVTNVLSDPKVEIFKDQTVVGSNDNWGGDPMLRAAMAAVGAFAFQSDNSADSAVYRPSTAFGGHTVQVSGVGGTRGAVLAELYDASSPTSLTSKTPRLVNVSVLKQIDANGSLTVGFVITGSSGASVLVRAVGPTLGKAPYNVPDVMADPKIILRTGQTTVATNDNWGGDATLDAIFAKVGAFKLPDGASKDAAFYVRLEPGSYTAEVMGVGGSSGQALVEVYEVP